MKHTTKILTSLVLFGLIGCGTLATDDVVAEDKAIGNEHQEGTLNSGPDSNEGAAVDNNGSVDSNQGFSTVNEKGDVNRGDLTPSNGDLDGDGILDIDDADIDGDGINNIDDADIDGDGINNIDDNDIDGDGIANENDNDLDGDGIENTVDTDVDGDGIVNEEDTDKDGDGIINEEDNDIDGDGIVNNNDGDIDGDGVENDKDSDIDGDGTDNSVDNDIDGDGIDNDVDSDIDGDGIDNGSDTDADGDGIDENTDPEKGISDTINESSSVTETFEAGSQTLTFVETVNLDSIRSEADAKGLQRSTIAITELQIGLDPNGGHDLFVANNGSKSFTMETRWDRADEQLILNSNQDALTVNDMVTGVSKNDGDLFTNAKGYSDLNRAIQDPNQKEARVIVTIFLSEPLDQEYSLSFAIDYTISGKVVVNQKRKRKKIEIKIPAQMVGIFLLFDRMKKKIALTLLFVLVALGFVFSGELTIAFQSLQAWLQDRSPWWGTLLVFVYVFACIIGAPVSPISVGAGAIYGFWWGLFWMNLSLIPCLFLLTYLGRKFFRSSFQKRVQNSPKLKLWYKAFEQKPDFLNFLLRVCGVTPFAAITYLLSLSNHNVNRLVWFAFVGTVPHKIIQVSLGSLGGELLAGESVGVLKWVGMVVGILLLAFTILKSKQLVEEETKKAAGL